MDRTTDRADGFVPMDPSALRGWDEDESDAVTVQMPDAFRLLEDDATDEVVAEAAPEGTLQGPTPHVEAPARWTIALVGAAVLLGAIGGALGALALG